MKSKSQKVFHEFEPFYNADSRVLILGSIPSPKSRESGFYYAHPQNRFWKVLSALFQTDEPKTIPEKKFFLTKHKIALYDVLESCEISGASDTSIKNPSPADLSPILEHAQVQKIFTTGKTAFHFYKKFQEPKLKREAFCLPSTSPTNCQKSLENLVSDYKIILSCLK